MATEELKILITAEVQDALNKVKAVKNNLTDINKSTGVNNMKSSFSESADAAAQLSDQLETIRNMNFTQLGASITKLGIEFKRYKEEMAEYKTLAKDAQAFLDPSSWIYKGDKSFLDWEGEAEAAANFEEHMKEANHYLGIAKQRGGGAFHAIAQGAWKAAAAVAAIAAELAIVIHAFSSAVKQSQRIRTDFFDSHKVGMSTAAYQEWAYVLGQVGVEADALSDFIKSLSAAQNDLRDGSEAMTQAFKDLGFNIEEVMNMGQEELFTETIRRLQQLEDQVQQTSIAYRIFGEDDAAKVANVLALNNQEMERMIHNYYLLGGGVSDAAIEKSLALQSAISNMKLAWQGLSTTLGEFVMPALTAVVRAITWVIAAVNMFLRAVFGLDIIAKGSKTVNKASTSMGGYSSAVKDATAATKELMRTTMGFDELNIVSDPNKAAGGGAADSGGFSGGGGSFDIPDLSGLTEDLGLDGWAEHLEKFKGVYQAVVPWVLMIAGAAIAVMCGMSGNWLGMVAGLGMAGLGIGIAIGNGHFEKLGQNIKKAAQNAVKWVKQAWNSFTSWWKKFWPEVKKIASNAWNGITTFFKNCWEGIKRTAKTVWDAISNFFKTCWNGIKNTATTIWNAVKKFFSDTWTSIKATATTAWNAIKKFFSDTWNAIKNTATTVWNAIKKFFTDTWTAIKNTATTIWTAVSKFFSDTWDSIKSTATTAWNNIKTFLTDTWNNIKTVATNTWNAIKQFFNDTWENIKTTAVNSWNTIKTNLEQAWENIKKKADDLCTNLKKFFKDAWDKIKETWDVVKQYFQDIWDKIKSSASSLTENVKNFFINAWSSIKSTWDTVKGYFQGIWDDIKNKASSMLESVKSFFSGAWTSIKNTWSGVSGWFGDVWTGIKGKFSGVSTWFGDTFGSAVTAIKNKWSDIKTWFQEKWNSVKSVFTSAGTSIGSSITSALKSSFNNFMSSAVGKINNFIGRLNSAIDLINKIPGVNLGKIGTLSVPQLAKGGIVTGSILANIGERGREAVLPLENNTGWMDALADRIAARNGSSTRVVLQVDGRELGWATIDNINAITKQTGGLQLVL